MVDRENQGRKTGLKQLANPVTLGAEGASTERTELFA
jgi:hypothetical protein